MNRSEAIAIEGELQERLLQAMLLARFDGTCVKIEKSYVYQLYYCRSNA